MSTKEEAGGVSSITSSDDFMDVQMREASKLSMGSILEMAEQSEEYEKKLLEFFPNCKRYEAGRTTRNPCMRVKKRLSGSDHGEKKYEIKIPTWKVLLWASPFTWYAMCQVVKICIMKQWYVQEAGADLTTMAVFIGLKPLVDAITDPMMSTWSDNLRSRFGRRRVFLIPASILGVFVFTLGFYPVDFTSKFGPHGFDSTLSSEDLAKWSMYNSIWYGIFHIMTAIVDTVFQIPFDGLGTELTCAYNQKSKIWFWRNQTMQAGVVFGAVVGLSLGKRIGFNRVSFMFACGLLVNNLVMIYFIKERPQETLPPPDKQKWSEDSVAAALIIAVYNRAFVSVAFMNMVQTIGYFLFLAVLPFFIQIVLGEAFLDATTQLTIILFASFFSKFLASYFWLLVSRKKGKYWSLQVGTICAALGCLTILFTGRDDGSGKMFFVALLGLSIIGFGDCAGYLVKDMVDDCCDYDEFLSGKRREALYQMAVDFIPKYGEVFTVALAFTCMGIVGYKPSTRWECYPDVEMSGLDNVTAWCETARTISNATTQQVFRIDEDGDPQNPICVGCSSYPACCSKYNKVQSDAMIWLMKICLGVTPGILYGLSTWMFTKFPKAARTKDGHDKLLVAIGQSKEGKFVVDPWFGENLQPAPPRSPHANILANITPDDLRILLGKEDEIDYDTLTRRSFRILAVATGIFIAGIIMFAVCLMTKPAFCPFGIVFGGMGGTLLWFNWNRWEASKELKRLEVPRESILLQDTLMCRFTGEKPFPTANTPEQCSSILHRASLSSKGSDYQETQDTGLPEDAKHSFDGVWVTSKDLQCKIAQGRLQGTWFTSFDTDTSKAECKLVAKGTMYTGTLLGREIQWSDGDIWKMTEDEASYI